MRRILALLLSLVVFLGGVNCMAENVNFSGEGVDIVPSPLGIYDASGKMLFSLGSLHGEVEDAIGFESPGYRLVLDADEIVLPVPVEPVPGATVAYADEVKALVSAAPATPAEVDAVLSPYGLGVSDLQDITGGIITANDAERGRITADRWKSLADIQSLQSETYALQLEAYEMEREMPYEQWLEEVKSSTTITRGMLSLMVEDVGRTGNSCCSVLYSAVPEIDALRSSLDLPEYFDMGLLVCLTSVLEGCSFDSLDDRDAFIKQTFEDLTGKYTEFNNLSRKACDVLISSFGYFTDKGEYVGMPVDADKLQSFTAEGKYCRYYSGTIEDPFEISAEYIQSLGEDARNYISPLYRVEVYFSSAGYIDRIRLQTLWE